MAHERRIHSQIHRPFIHEALLLTYLKITGLQLGFLLNWNVILMKYGIKRMINNIER
ncbi:MAG: hypothetical protein DRH90_18445 [Deltaproteobacteria bacterium]|nr:MAG: hypothetical protein DRH90_18445 [Deltaproteobacteria bacterium]